MRTTIICYIHYFLIYNTNHELWQYNKKTNTVMNYKRSSDVIFELPLCEWGVVHYLFLDVEEAGALSHIVVSQIVANEIILLFLMIARKLHQHHWKFTDVLNKNIFAEISLGLKCRDKLSIIWIYNVSFPVVIYLWFYHELY